MDFRDKFLAVEDRAHRDFRRLNGRLTMMNEQLVHGPYSQERREQLLVELLKAQLQANEGGKGRGYDNVELISIEELDEIRRIWVEVKGEIEDSLPRLYEQATGLTYPGRELDPMPLEPGDLMLLKRVVGHWSMSNQLAEEPEVRRERRLELYKLVRTLLATSFRGLQSHRRSEQLDELASLLKAFAFIDEADALTFANQHQRTDQEASLDARGDDLDEPPVPDGESISTRRTIPIAVAAETNLLI
jgi:DNA sulfur modification protein DndC